MGEPVLKTFPRVLIAFYLAEIKREARKQFRALDPDRRQGATIAMHPLDIEAARLAIAGRAIRDGDALPGEIEPWTKMAGLPFVPDPAIERGDLHVRPGPEPNPDDSLVVTDRSIVFRERKLG